jgi:hypothetical protein
MAKCTPKDTARQETPAFTTPTKASPGCEDYTERLDIASSWSHADQITTSFSLVATMESQTCPLTVRRLYQHLALFNRFEPIAVQDDSSSDTSIPSADDEISSPPLADIASSPMNLSDMRLPRPFTIKPGRINAVTMSTKYARKRERGLKQRSDIQGSSTRYETTLSIKHAHYRRSMGPRM